MEKIPLLYKGIYENEYINFYKMIEWTVKLFKYFKKRNMKRENYKTKFNPRKRILKKNTLRRHAIKPYKKQLN